MNEETNPNTLRKQRDAWIKAYHEDFGFAQVVIDQCDALMPEDCGCCECSKCERRAERQAEGNPDTTLLDYMIKHGLMEKGKDGKYRKKKGLTETK